MRIPKEPKKLKTLSLLGGSVLMLSSICQNTQAAALYNFTYISNIDSIVYFSGGVITGLGPPNTTDIVTGIFTELLTVTL